MKIALCNEVLREMDFPAQCALAARLGYEGLELAPFTLGENPQELSGSARQRIRREASDAGIDIIGLHWLLVTPAGLSINGRDASVRKRTVEVLRALIGLCADLGGRILVHGSPGQRQVDPQDSIRDAWDRALETFRAVRKEAEDAGVTYCIEPLDRKETNFLNSLDEAARFVEQIESPAFKSMIDTKAARLAEEASVPELIDRWLPRGLIGHVQVNDRNLRGPGQGDDEFASVFAALARHRYQGTVSVEPFDYYPDGPACAARSIGFVRGVLEGLNHRRASSG